MHRVCCPIGDGESRFKEPGAIAIDVVARLLRDITRASSLAVDSQAEVPSTSSADLMPREVGCETRKVIETTKRELKNEVPGLFL